MSDASPSLSCRCIQSVYRTFVCSPILSAHGPFKPGSHYHTVSLNCADFGYSVLCVQHDSVVMLVPFQIIRFVDSVDICDYKLRISSVILHMHFVCFGRIRVINAIPLL